MVTTGRIVGGQVITASVDPVSGALMAPAGDPPIPLPPATVYQLGANPAFSSWLAVAAAVPQVIVIPAALMPGMGTSYDDGSAINWALANYQTVGLIAGLTYAPTTQLLIPPAAALISTGNYFRARTGPVIQPVGMTSGSAITFGAGTPAGAAMGLRLDGSRLPAGAVDGIAITNAAKQGTLADIDVANFTQHGVDIFAGSGSPDGWLLKDLSPHNNAADGLHWAYCVDSLAENIHADSNGGTGIFLNNLNNTIIKGAKSQSNTNGYLFNMNFGKPSGAMIGCFSEGNLQDGWLSASSSNAGTLSLVGCGARDDGKSGTSGSGYSGFNLSFTGIDLLLDNCFTHISAAASGPDYGLKLVNCTGNVLVNNCSLIGSVAAYLNGGGNTSVKWGNNVLAVGENDARTVTYTRNAGTATFSGTGAQTVFTINHGLAFTPSSWSVTPGSAAASGAFSVTASATQLTVTYVAAPAAGSNNVVLTWQAQT